MVQVTTANILKEKNTDMVNSLGLITVLMKVPLLRTILKEKVGINGPMDVSMKALGKTTKWKAEAFSNGLIRENMKENMSMIRKKERVFSIGPMVACTMVNGRMENNMAVVSTPTIKDQLEKENGSKENEQNG